MQKPKNEPSLIIAFILSFVVLFMMGFFVLYPQDIVRSLLAALVFSPIVVIFEHLTRKPKYLFRLAARIEQLATEPAANKKERIKKIALIGLFFAGFTSGNALLLDIVTGGSDPRILTASPIVGAIYTYLFIKILRKKRKHFKS